MISKISRSLKSRLGCALSLLPVLSACMCCMADKEGVKPINPPDPYPPGYEGTVSIAYLKSSYSGHPYTVTDNYYIEGVVTSTDITGNLFQTLVIEDQTAGIEIKIDDDQLYKRFKIGELLKIHCNNLTLGSYSGVIQLGGPAEGSYETSYLPLATFNQRFSREGFADDRPVPLNLAIGDLSVSHISRFVRFGPVQFSESDLGSRWAENDQYTEYRLSDANSKTVFVRTSPYATFADVELPSGSGEIDGILSYFGGEFRLVVLFMHDIWMDEPRF